MPILVLLVLCLAAFLVAIALIKGRRDYHRMSQRWLEQKWLEERRATERDWADSDGNVK